MKVFISTTKSSKLRSWRDLIIMTPDLITANHFHKTEELIIREFSEVVDRDFSENFKGIGFETGEVPAIPSNGHSYFSNILKDITIEVEISQLDINYLKLLLGSDAVKVEGN